MFEFCTLKYFDIFDIDIFIDIFENVARYFDMSKAVVSLDIFRQRHVATTNVVNNPNRNWQLLYVAKINKPKTQKPKKDIIFCLYIQSNASYVDWFEVVNSYGFDFGLFSCFNFELRNFKLKTLNSNIKKNK